jgi:hypothetical protein
MLSQIVPDLDNRTLTVGGTPTTVRVYNVPAFSSTAFAVPGDTECTDVSWTKDPLAPASNTAPTKGVSPFGSTSGRNYLAAENGGTGPGSAAGTDFGCVDVARSSGAPRAAGGGDKSTFEYYAFALDALSWSTTSMKAPGTLTIQNLKDIYVNCTITDWSQLPGGTAGPIVRYFPQAGSGTRSFFISDILGGATPPTTGACASSPLKLMEENQGTAIDPADLDKAIVPYSAAVWSFHAQNSINPSLDKRGGARLGGITTAPTAPLTAVKSSPVFWNGTDRQYQLDTAGPVHESNVKQANPTATEANGLFPGVRFVYNVIDAAGGGTRKGYQAAKQLVGFTNTSGGVKSPLCDATPAGTGATEFALILSNGFAPLTATANGTSNQAGSTCRFYAGVN